MSKVREMIATIMRELGMSDATGCALSDLEDVDAAYRRRDGFFDLMVDEEGEVVGCVGLWRLDARTAELRRMYLAAPWRGWGLGRLLLSHALRRARELGYHRIEAATARSMMRAIALYESVGFERTTVAGDAAAAAATGCDLRLRLDLDRASGFGLV